VPRGGWASDQRVTAQMFGCTAALSWMRHDNDGAVHAAA